MQKTEEDRVWVVHTGSDQCAVYHDKRDAESFAFDLALSQSIDGDVSIETEPRREVTYFWFDTGDLVNTGPVFVVGSPLH